MTEQPTPEKANPISPEETVELAQLYSDKFNTAMNKVMETTAGPFLDTVHAANETEILMDDLVSISVAARLTYIRIGISMQRVAAMARAAQPTYEVREVTPEAYPDVDSAGWENIPCPDGVEGCAVLHQRRRVVSVDPAAPAEDPMAPPVLTAEQEDALERLMHDVQLPECPTCDSTNRPLRLYVEGDDGNDVQCEDSWHAVSVIPAASNANSVPVEGFVPVLDKKADDGQ